MQQPDNKLYYLWQQYLSGRATGQELNELMEAIGDASRDDENIQLFQQAMQKYPAGAGLTDDTQSEMWRRISERAGSGRQPVHRVHFLRKWGWAAAVLILLCSGAYFWMTAPKGPKTVTLEPQPADVLPGSNKAILTLADGTTITLDSAANGAIAQQGNSSVVKLANGEIRYDLKGAASGGVMLNTMSTPAGGQYQLTLPDGTRVWLNAASSITYPAAFVTKERKVKISGEAYFEVAKDKAKPFVVDVNGQASVEVLGTSFNIKAYADEEATRTTLINGSVKVRNNATSVVLSPGQQGVSSDRQLAVINNANVEQVVAWKNGIFDFNGLAFQAIIKDVGRWYDIRVKYEGEVPAFKLKGKMDRGVKLSDLLRFMKGFGLQVRLEGRVLTIKQ